MSLERERLTALLLEQTLTSVELIIAPPGYGKTTVLRDYAAHDDEALLVAVPEGADLEAFIRAIVAAAIPAALASLGAVFDGHSGPELEARVAAWLVARLRAFGGTLIVDDFHRAANDEAIARVLVATIAATHGRTRWIIASREAPRFPMGSWIARGWMGLPVSGEDLRFTPAEAAALAESLGIPATSADIDAIVAETLGWPIGVRLALTLVARKRVAGQTRMQTREALFALIDDEVWRPLGAETQRLIRAAALIPSPAISTLVASGFTEAPAGIASVFEKIPFVTPIDADAFLIHDLFREFVASRTPADDDTGEITKSIGVALVETGHPADGLRLLVAADRVDDVERALGLHAFDLLESGHRNAVSAALAFVAERGRGDRGVSLSISGALSFADGSSGNASNLWARALDRDLPPQMRGEVARRLAINYILRQLYDEALTTLTAARDAPDATIADRLEAEALLAIARAAGKPEQRDDVRAQIRATEAKLRSVTAKVQARVLQRLGTAAYSLGDMEASERLSHDAALLAANLGMDTVTALAYGTLQAIAGQIDDDTQRARSFLRSQAAAAERAANTSLRVYALRSEYTLAAANAEFAEADAIEATLSALPDARAYRDTFIFRIARATRYAAAGQLSRAESLLKTTHADGTAERAFRGALTILLHLIGGNRAAASVAIERGLVGDAAQEFWERAVVMRAYALRGVAYWALDRPAQARKAFGFDASNLQRRDQILVNGLRALCEMPHPLPDPHAIDALCRPLLDADWGAFVAILRALVARDANDVALSTAEIETLREFDRVGGRAADVAKALGKSKFTVQNQVQSAIKKIGVSGRAEAIAYARKRGWLDTTS